MSNIITLRVPQRRLSLAERTGAMAESFALHRRSEDDVFWLKENAEFLNICECTGLPLDAEALEHWDGFVARLPERLSFFPQYYRFLISIALDLEDLGYGDAGAEAACAWVAEQGLPEAELSDLQRAEARRLLARRGQGTIAADPWIDDRLRAFVDRAATFALPNKKAAYELTHIVFYLSEYGRRDPGLSDRALQSLEYAGVLALLEQNMDLLAEVCVAMRYAGRVPSPVWECQVCDALAAFSVEEGGAEDDYHAYLVGCWSATLAGDAGRGAGFAPGPLAFCPPRLEGPLRQMSTLLLGLDRARSNNWGQMRHMIYDAMDGEGRAVLDAAERSTAHFDAFFEGFARARA